MGLVRHGTVGDVIDKDSASFRPALFIAARPAGPFVMEGGYGVAEIGIDAVDVSLGFEGGGGASTIVELALVLVLREALADRFEKLVAAERFREGVAGAQLLGHGQEVRGLEPATARNRDDR